jgi:hypothetical protein
MSWSWERGLPHERAAMVRGHACLSDEHLRTLFHLTPDGLAAIMNGDDWRPEYVDPDIAEQRRKA